MDEKQNIYLHSCNLSQFQDLFMVSFHNLIGITSSTYLALIWPQKQLSLPSTSLASGKHVSVIKGSHISYNINIFYVTYLSEQWKLNVIIMMSHFYYHHRHACIHAHLHACIHTRIHTNKHRDRWAFIRDSLTNNTCEKWSTHMCSGWW